MKAKKTSIVDELAEKYQDLLALAQKQLKKGRPRLRASYESDVILFQKWAYRVGKGWYGFNLGPVPAVWRQVLDEFLEWLEMRRPDFEIHQVKMKFRRLRLYLGTKTDFIIPDENIRSEISKLEQLLSLPEYSETPVRTAQKKNANARPNPEIDSHDEHKSYPPRCRYGIGHSQFSFGNEAACLPRRLWSVSART